MYTHMYIFVWLASRTTDDREFLFGNCSVPYIYIYIYIYMYVCFWPPVAVQVLDEPA